MTTAAEDKRFRILSLDGGGIYGLFSILLLREMCRRGGGASTLLQKGGVDLLAGSGSGAINAMILAKYDHPREGFEEAIQFWSDERLYRNSGPWNFMINLQGWMSILTSDASPQEKYEQSLRYWDSRRTSFDPWNAQMGMLGLTSWFGHADVMAVLKSHFEDMRLSDLKHNILITAFDWGGDPDLPVCERHWKPKVYFNFPDSEKDRRSRVVDVAMSALSWMYTLPIHNSEQGGEWYSPDPTMCAVVKAVNFVSQKLQPPMTQAAFKRVWSEVLEDVSAPDQQRAAETLRQRVTEYFEDTIASKEDEAYKYLLASAEGTEAEALVAAAFPYLGFMRSLAELEEPDLDVRVMRHLSVLSVGTGSKVPYMPVETEEWGYGTWNSGIYNQELQRWVAPMQYIHLQGPKEMTREQCQWLLNDPDAPESEGRYYSLDPQVFTTPVLTTMLGLRNNPGYLASLLKEIDLASTGPEAWGDIERTLSWLEAQGWFDKERWAISPAP